MPLSAPSGCDVKTFKKILNRQDFFFPIPQEWLPYFPEDKFFISYDESESDYIYLTEKWQVLKEDNTYVVEIILISFYLHTCLKVSRYRR